MSKPFKVNEELSIYVVVDENDSLLMSDFYNRLYNNVFSDKDNNLKAGLVGIDGPNDLRLQIETWLNDSSPYMFFLFKGNDVIGTTQAFKSSMFSPSTLSLGYTLSPLHQGKGYGTIMLKFVSEYLHSDKLWFDLVLGFRDGNTASERIAAKNNYTYYLRTTVADAEGVRRPMTYYKYNGKQNINEGYNVISQKKVLTTNQWIEDSDKIISRINPKILSFNEYVYLTTSSNKPVTLDETYFVFTSAHYGLMDQLKKEKIKTISFGVTDRAAKNMFDPSKKGDIVLDEFFNLVESDLKILEINKEKTAMILGNENGEVKVKKVGNVMLVEDFAITKK